MVAPTGDNLISDKAVKKLELLVEDHPKPYTIGWIRKVTSLELNTFLRYCLLSGRDIVTLNCDVVEMDGNHTQLSRLLEPIYFPIECIEGGNEVGLI